MKGKLLSTKAAGHLQLQTQNQDISSTFCCIRKHKGTGRYSFPINLTAMVRIYKRLAAVQAGFVFTKLSVHSELCGEVAHMLPPSQVLILSELSSLLWYKAMTNALAKPVWNSVTTERLN